MLGHCKAPTCYNRIQISKTCSRCGGPVTFDDAPTTSVVDYDEERRAICAALANLGFDDEDRWLSGEPIEKCREHFERLTETTWSYNYDPTDEEQGPLERGWAASRRYNLEHGVKGDGSDG